MVKTATIKLRLSEDEKSNWEAQATADGVSLSSLIRHRMNHPTTRADGGLVPAPPDSGSSPARQGCPANGKPCHCSGLCRLPAGSAFPGQGLSATATEKQWAERNKQLDGTALVGNAIALLAERRSIDCEHGRPQYVFCPTCD